MPQVSWRLGEPGTGTAGRDGTGAGRSGTRERGAAAEAARTLTAHPERSASGNSQRPAFRRGRAGGRGEAGRGAGRTFGHALTSVSCVLR